METVTIRLNALWLRLRRQSFGGVAIFRTRRIVAHARSVRLIGESRRKDDRLDARTLARLVRIDPELLCSVKHRSAEAQADLTVIRAREPPWPAHGRSWSTRRAACR